MDAQMKRGFLEACVLATLCDGESYGYRIIKDVPKSLALTESTLYPLLKRLEGGGLIAVRSAEHNGRLRKYYRITDEGTRHIEGFLDEREGVLALYRFVENAARGGAAQGDVEYDDSAQGRPTHEAPTQSGSAHENPEPDDNAAHGRPTRDAFARSKPTSGNPAHSNRSHSATKEAAHD
ncbi:MAG: PadR family transcriptional regulator [Eggerthellaceae bacterium]|nr:PadR family transcriptional regulator [Eggerthellaceae bacterium]